MIPVTEPAAAASRAGDLIDELAARRLVADCTGVDALRARLARGAARVYCGFDPTADSLHVGSLTPLAVLALMRRHGHEPILLIGGATGMIGDPSGRSAERNLLALETLDANRAALHEQMATLLSDEGEPPTIVDNRDWFAEMSLIEFLQRVGKHAPVGQMLARRSVQTRLQAESGLSFTEFTYQLMQAYDFWYLRTRHACEVQVGGTDQWGNVTV